jgi:hypothetical protein
MINTNTDNKLMTMFGTSMMMAVGSISMLYILQQLFPQQVQVQPESYGIWYLGPAGHIMNAENGVDEEPLYMGEAAPGTLNSDAGWRIYKYVYVRDPVSGDMLSGTIRYAGGSTKFDKVWDERASYEYA